MTGSEATMREATSEGSGHLWLGDAAIPALILAVYWGMWRGEVLSWDDGVWLGDPVLAMGLIDAAQSAFTTTVQGSWYPLLRLSWWLQANTVGVYATTCHAVNLGLFAACALLLRTLMDRCGMSRFAALAACLVWVAHPTRVESVAWITSRKDLFSLALVLAWGHLILGRRSPLLTASVWVAALLVKVAVAPVFVPATLLLLRERSWDERRSFLWIYLGLTAPVAAIAVVANTENAGFYPVTGVVDALGFVAWLQAEWLGRLVLLTPNVAIVPVPEAWPAWVLAGPLALAGLALTAWRASPRWAPGLVALWIVPLLPVHGMVPMAYWAADRHLLIPSIAVAVGLALLAERWQTAGVASVAVLVLALGSSARTRALDWQSDIDLWSREVRAPGEHWVRYVQLGTAYGRAGDFSAAATSLRAARDMRPADGRILARLLIAELALDGWSETDAAIAGALQPPPNHSDDWLRVAQALRRNGAPQLAAAIDDLLAHESRR